MANDPKRAVLVDRRERLVGAVATVTEAQGKAFGDNSILARYEKTRVYRSAIAVKAARTRRRNLEDALDIEEPIETGPAALIEAPVEPSRVLKNRSDPARQGGRGC